MDFLLAYLPYASTAWKIDAILMLRALLIADNRLDNITARRCEQVLGALRRRLLRAA
jgi:hypothetical protein